MMQIINEYLEIIVDVAYWFQVFCVSLLTVTALDVGIKKKRDIIVGAGKVILLMLIFFVFNLFMFMVSKIYFYFAGIGTWFSFLGGILLYAALFCRYQNNAKMVTVFAVFSLTIIVLEFGAVMGNVLEVEVVGFDGMYTKTVADVLILLVAVVFRRRPVSRYEVSIYAARTNIICGILSALTVIITDLFMIHGFHAERFHPVRILIAIIFMILYVINIINYLMTYSLSKEQNTLLTIQAETQLSQSAERLLAVSDYNIAELRKINHDIKNQYAYMSVMLKKQEYEELNNYFEEMLGTFSAPLVPYVDCGNRVLNAILNLENAKAEESGVKFDYKIAVPQELPFSELDLCNLITNIMDNAIEACRTEAIENAIVVITMGIQGDYLFMRIENPTKKTNEIFKKPIITSKADKKLHGNGMQIVRQIVKKYNGHYKNSIEASRFLAEILLDMCLARE